MPAYSSSPIAVLADRAGPVLDGVIDAQEWPGSGTVDLLAALGEVPDPRARRGMRHRLVTVLAVAVCAVLAGARSYVAIAEWAHDLPVGVRVRLGMLYSPGAQQAVAPSESTIRRVRLRMA